MKGLIRGGPGVGMGSAPTRPQPLRLERLKEVAGLSWREFAEKLGVTQRGMLKWRRGGRPSGANVLAIMELASGVPGGYRLMLNGDDGAEG